MSEAHHYVATSGKIYVDTAFINAVQRLPGMEVKHMGFGEFSLITPDGEVEFDRMRGTDFPGQSGRSHQLYDTAGGQKVAEKVVKEMERKGKSLRVESKGEQRMSNKKRIEEMANNRTHSYDGWRLRDLSESRANSAQADFVEHQNALGVLGKKLERGDIAGVVQGLKEIQSRIGKTIEGLK